MMEHLRLFVNLYSTTTLLLLFLWYVFEDLTGLIPAPLSAEVLLDFLCGGLLVKKCWQSL